MSILRDSDDSEFEEVDPSGRYGRYNEILGRGASKIVYRAFDEFEGIEVAWNQVKLNDLLQSPEDLERLYSEIHLLKTLKHKNIMKFYASWVDIPNRNINFVTEMFTSGTLRQYRLKHKRVNIRAVKHWCRQILKGLVYLHNHDPPVIHRDLKCDNIFVNGNHGEVKIGDLGLAAILQKSQAARCVGTPEFMAPEVFAESYNELVDIYSFGMCILEMVTSEYPYSECTHQAQIYKKVTSGKKPDVLYKVKDPEVRQFVEKCLASVPYRLSAMELLDDPFLEMDEFDHESQTLDNGSPPGHHFVNDSRYSFSDAYLNDSDHGYDNHYELEHYFHPSGMELFEHNDDDSLPNVDISIKGKKRDDGSIFLRLRTDDKEGQIRNIYFPFVIENDTALSVATEMVAELDIMDQDVTKIADMINGEIASLVPEWRPWTGFTETPGSANYVPSEDCAPSPTSSGSYAEFLSHRPRDTLMEDQLDKIVCHSNQSAIGVDLNGSGYDQCDDLAGQLESLDITPVGSGRSLSDDDCGKFDISIDNGKKRMIVDDGIPFLVKNAIENLPVCSCCTLAHSDDAEEEESEILQRLRWVRALSHMELRKVRDQQLGIASCPAIKGDQTSCNSSSSSLNLRTAKCCRDPGADMCDPKQEGLRVDVVAWVKCAVGTFFPNSLHRTTSLPVDAVDL